MWKKQKVKLDRNCIYCFLDENGYTALSLACQSGEVEVVEYLHVTTKQNPWEDKMDKEGMIGFLHACKHGHIDVVKYFLQEEIVGKIDKKSIFGTIPEKKGKRTPLMFAAMSGNLDLVTLIHTFDNSYINDRGTLTLFI